MQPSIGTDDVPADRSRRKSRIASAVRSSRSRYQVPASVPTVPRQSFRNAAHSARPRRRVVRDVDPQSGCRAEPGEQVVDAVALVVAEKDRIAEAAPAEIDPARVHRACRAETHARWRHAARRAPWPRYRRRAIAGFERQLRPDPIGADLAQETRACPPIGAQGRLYSLPTSISSRPRRVFSACRSGCMNRACRPSTRAARQPARRRRTARMAARRWPRRNRLNAVAAKCGDVSKASSQSS